MPVASVIKPLIVSPEVQVPNPSKTIGLKYDKGLFATPVLRSGVSKL